MFLWRVNIFLSSRFLYNTPKQLQLTCEDFITFCDHLKPMTIVIKNFVYVHDGLILLGAIEIRNINLFIISLIVIIYFLYFVFKTGVCLLSCHLTILNIIISELHIKTNKIPPQVYKSCTLHKTVE